MPWEAETRVNHFGTKQKMPKSLTFGDRHGREILDNLDEVGDWSDDDDDTYKFQDDMDNDDLSYDDTQDEVEDIDVNIPHDEAAHAETPSIQLIAEDVDNHQNTGVENQVPTTDNITSNESVEDDQDPDMASQITGVEQGLDMASQTAGVEDCQDMDEENSITTEHQSTEETEYEKAEQLGIESAHHESAHNEDAPLPKRTRKKKADEIYEYYNAMFAGIDVGHVFQPMMTNTQIKCLVS